MGKGKGKCLSGLTFVEIEDGGENPSVAVRVVDVVRVAGGAGVVARNHGRGAPPELPAQRSRQRGVEGGRQLVDGAPERGQGLQAVERNALVLFRTMTYQVCMRQ